jgi:hypothetical protein
MTSGQEARAPLGAAASRSSSFLLQDEGEEAAGDVAADSFVELVKDRPRLEQTLGRAERRSTVQSCLYTQQAAYDIVEAVSPHEHPILKEDFYDSLCAAFTMEEVKAQVRHAGLPLEVGRASDRHMLIKGVLR